MGGACSNLRIARIKLRKVKLPGAAASTSTTFTHLYDFEMHKKKVRAADLT